MGLSTVFFTIDFPWHSWSTGSLFPALLRFFVYFSECSFPASFGVFPSMLPLGVGAPQGSMLNLQLFPLAYLDLFSSIGYYLLCLCLQICISSFRPFAELQVCGFNCLLTILSGFLEVHSNEHVKNWAYLYPLLFLRSCSSSLPISKSVIKCC